MQECRARGMPVIYDEVFCGLWRLGVESTRELLGEDPDVSCYAKLLTGGLVPMAATLATERVFDAFSGAKVSQLAGLQAPELIVALTAPRFWCAGFQRFRCYFAVWSECGAF